MMRTQGGRHLPQCCLDSPDTPYPLNRRNGCTSGENCCVPPRGTSCPSDSRCGCPPTTTTPNFRSSSNCGTATFSDFRCSARITCTGSDSTCTPSPSPTVRSGRRYGWGGAICCGCQGESGGGGGRSIGGMPGAAPADTSNNGRRPPGAPAWLCVGARAAASTSTRGGGPPPLPCGATPLGTGRHLTWARSSSGGSVYRLRIDGTCYSPIATTDIVLPEARVSVPLLWNTIFPPETATVPL